MGRIRTVKPSFYKHEELFEAEKASGLPLRVAFSGLWTVADREGRFAWKPRALKTDVLPYDDVDFSLVLDALAKYGFVVKYVVQGREYGCVPSWSDHQVINSREADSSIPPRVTDLHVHAHEETPRVTDLHTTRHGLAQGEGKGREGKRNDDISPEMVMRGVITELCISGRELSAVIGDVCKFEMKAGKDATVLRDEMVSAYRDWNLGRTDMSFPVGDEKFFGQGYWKERSKWPWKDGKRPNEVRPITAAEKMRRAS